MDNPNEILLAGIEVLIISDNDDSREFADLTPNFDKISEGIVLGDMIAGDQIFKTTKLERGIHLHWKLPDCLMHGIKKEGEFNVEYPSVPNRWLVIRFLKQSENWGVSKAWVVESDNIFYEEWPENITSISVPFRDSKDAPLWYRYLGCKYDCKNWSEKSTTNPGLFLDKLTAIGPGDLFFAAYYPNCRSVFGLHDDLSDINKETKIDDLSKNLAYAVFGWYSNPNQNEHVCLLYGMVSDISHQADIFKVWDGNICIALGNTSVEALSAILYDKYVDGSTSRLLNALQYKHLSKIDNNPDGFAELETSNYQKAFTPVSGGKQWIVVNSSLKSPNIEGKERYPNSNEPFPGQIGNLLAKLNDDQNSYEKLQRDLASIQWELYSAWYKYIQARDDPFSLDSEINDILKYIDCIKNNKKSSVSSIKTQLSEIKIKLKNSKKELGKELKNTPYKLHHNASPNFWQANEPVLLLFRPKSSSDLTSGHSSKTEPFSFSDDIANLDLSKIREEIRNKIKDRLTSLNSIKCNFVPPSALFMLWEVDLLRPIRTILEGTNFEKWSLDDIDFKYCSTDKLEKQSHQYQGLTVLSPHAHENLQSLLKKDVLAQMDIFSQSLGGFNDALLMRKQTLQFPVFDRPEEYGGNPKLAEDIADFVGDMNHLSPLIDYNFNPVREGFLELSRLWIVDSFGRIQKIKKENENIEPNLSVSEIGRTEGKESYITLAPRITQPSRLQFRWISASPEDQKVESNSDPGTSPVFGWIMPNHLDKSLVIYHKDGKVLGSLQLAFDKSKVHLNFPPGKDTTQNEPQIEDANLGAVINAIKRHPEAFDEFFAHIDETLEGIETLGSRHDQTLSVLIGRPLALARATLQLELYGLPAYNQSWESLGKWDTHGLESVKFPVRLGDANQLKDGLIGYFLSEEKDGIFHSAHGFSKKEGNDFMSYDHQITLTCDPNAKPVALTLLIDPRGGVHITSGILPVKFIELPHYHISEALSAMEVSFLTAPLIVRPITSGAIDMPLPATTHGNWSFVHKEADNWRELEAASKGLNVVLAPGSQRIIEGWLKLRNADETETN
jgi:hypothetical protein